MLPHLSWARSSLRADIAHGLKAGAQELHAISYTAEHMQLLRGSKRNSTQSTLPASKQPCNVLGFEGSNLRHAGEPDEAPNNQIILHAQQ